MRTAYRVGRLVAGGACIGLGVVGLFLPFLQGILFLVVGLSLLSTESTHARRLRDGLRHWVRRRRAALNERKAK